MLKGIGSFQRYQVPTLLPRSCTRHLGPQPWWLHRRAHYAASQCKTFNTQINSAQGKFYKHAGPNISQLAPHLQQEWDHTANAHLGSITITPQSHRKVWWSSGTCKTGQLHRWQAVIESRTNGAECPYNAGQAACPCNDLAHNHPEVAVDWDWNANNVPATPETITAGSVFKASWRCGVCGHSWSARMADRTRGSGCPECALEASRIQPRQPSISIGAPHLLAEWDWEGNKRSGLHPDQVSLGSHKKVHWVVQDECKLGLVHRWQAAASDRVKRMTGSPFPSGKGVCACNSLAVQCPEAAQFWDFLSDEGLTPDGVAVKSNKLVAWKGPHGSQWEQSIHDLVKFVRRHQAKLLN